jgi:hypothetical protein
MHVLNQNWERGLDFAAKQKHQLADLYMLKIAIMEITPLAETR